MAPRNSTPTSGWQWTHVKFSNPSSRANITDWFGLNTGDVRIVMKKNLSDSLQLPLIDGRDSDNFDSHATIEFIESMPTHATLANILVEVRKDTADFARGGPARNFGSGLCSRQIFNSGVGGFALGFNPSCNTRHEIFSSIVNIKDMS